VSGSWKILVKIEWLLLHNSTSKWSSHLSSDTSSAFGYQMPASYCSHSAFYKAVCHWFPTTDKMADGQPWKVLVFRYLWCSDRWGFLRKSHSRLMHSHT